MLKSSRLLRIASLYTPAACGIVLFFGCGTDATITEKSSVFEQRELSGTRRGVMPAMCIVHRVGHGENSTTPRVVDAIVGLTAAGDRRQVTIEIEMPVTFEFTLETTDAKKTVHKDEMVYGPLAIYDQYHHMEATLSRQSDKYEFSASTNYTTSSPGIYHYDITRSCRFLFSENDLSDSSMPGLPQFFELHSTYRHGNCLTRENNALRTVRCEGGALHQRWTTLAQGQLVGADGACLRSRQQAYWVNAIDVSDCETPASNVDVRQKFRLRLKGTDQCLEDNGLIPRLGLCKDVKEHGSPDLSEYWSYTGKNYLRSHRGGVGNDHCISVLGKEIDKYKADQAWGQMYYSSSDKCPKSIPWRYNAKQEMRSGDKCLTAEPDRIAVKPCDGSNEQQWEMFLSRIATQPFDRPMTEHIVTNAKTGTDWWAREWELRPVE